MQLKHATCAQDSKTPDRTRTRGRIAARGALTAALAAVLLACPLQLQATPEQGQQGPGIALVASQAFAAFDKTVDDLAKDKTLKELTAEQTMENNFGTITTNNGWLRTNASSGTVETNACLISLNEGLVKASAGEGAFIDRNNGTIESARAVVRTNYGTIKFYAASKNPAGVYLVMNAGTITTCTGTVGFNEGTIDTFAGVLEENSRSGYIKTVSDTAIIQTNLGSIGSIGDAEIVYNYGSVNKTTSKTVIDHQFYAVDAKGVYTATVPNSLNIQGLDQNALDNHYGSFVEKGTPLVITPAAGWYIAGVTGIDGQATVTLADDGTRVTLSNITDDLTFNVVLGKMYDLRIGGVMVTTANCNDVFNDGTVSFNPLTNRLFFTNAQVDATGTDYAAVESAAGLNMYFSGNCTLTGDEGMGSLNIHGDLAIKDSGDDATIALVGGGYKNAVVSPTVRVTGTFAVEDGDIGISQDLSAGAYSQTGGNVVVQRSTSTASGVSCGMISIADGSFTSYGPISNSCRMTITGGDVVFDCTRNSQFLLQETRNSIVIAPAGSEPITVVYGTSTSEGSAEGEARPIASSPVYTTADVTSQVRPAYLPAGTKACYFATHPGVMHDVTITDNGVTRAVQQDAEGLPFYVSGQPATGYKVASVAAQTASSTPVALAGPDEQGNYSFTMPAEDVTVAFTYGAVSYEIDFDANVPASASTEVSGSVNDAWAEYDTFVTLPSNEFVLPGYAFAGWNTAPDGSGTAFDDGDAVTNLTTEDDAVVTLYAQWTPRTYTVTYNGNGAAGTMEAQTMTFDQTYYLYSLRYTMDGCTFLYWQKTGGLIGQGTRFANNATVRNLCTFDADGTPRGYELEAHWMAEKPVIITILQDGQPATGLANRITLVGEYTSYSSGTFAEVEDGVYVAENNPDMPFIYDMYNVVINGYETRWWVAISEGSSASLTLSYFSVTLAAEWTGGGLNPCTWSVDSAAPRLVDGDSTFVIKGSPISINVGADALGAGYSFDAWVSRGTDPDPGWDPQAAQTSFVIEGATNLLATRAPNTYYVAFDGNVPDGCSSALEGAMLDQKLWYDSPTQLVPCEYELVGYEFAGWNTAADGSGTAYADEASALNLSSVQDDTVTLYAQWQPITYFAAYHPNGAAGAVMYQSIAYDTNASVFECMFTWDYRHFVEWNTDPQGTGTAYAMGGLLNNMTTVAGTVFDLYAQWDFDLYTITFDANAPEFATAAPTGTMADMSLACDPSIGGELPLNAFALEGYQFAGWNTAPDGTGQAFADGDALPNLSTETDALVTLYAQWTRDSAFYQFIEGMNGSWERGTSAALQFRTNGAYGLFGHAEVDGAALGREACSTWEGSTYLALQASYLEGLSAGTHTLTAVYEDGSCSTTFTVTEPNNMPNTGDTMGTPVKVLIGAAAAALIIAIIAFIARRKK